MRVFVTGADGFIGRVLVSRLKELGVDVFAYSRRVSGDLFEFPLRTELRGYDTVVHLAGLAHINADPDRFYQSNVAVSEKVAQESVAAGVAHLIYVSSLGTVASSEHSPYIESKRRAEGAIQRVRSEGVTIVRPALVYGPGDQHGNFIRLIRRIDEGRLVVVSKMAKKHVVYIDSLVTILTEIGLGPPPAGCQGLNVFDEVVSLETMSRVVGTELGREVRLVSLPSWAAKLAVCLTGWVRETSFGRDVRRVMTGGEHDGVPQGESHGPPSGPGFRDGVRETVQWYRTLSVSSPQTHR